MTPKELLAEHTHLRENELGEEYVECEECGASAWGNDATDIWHNDGCSVEKQLKELPDENR